jgi:antitoxin YefM
MITGIREKTIVGENGRIEIPSSDLPAGAEVEVIVLVENGEEQDTTEYLLSTEANREHLMKAIRDAENPDNLIRVDLENL